MDVWQYNMYFSFLLVSYSRRSFTEKHNAVLKREIVIYGVAQTRRLIFSALIPAGDLRRNKKKSFHFLTFILRCNKTQGKVDPAVIILYNIPDDAFQKVISAVSKYQYQKRVGWLLLLTVAHEGAKCWSCCVKLCVLKGWHVHLQADIAQCLKSLCLKTVPPKFPKQSKAYVTVILNYMFKTFRALISRLRFCILLFSAIREPLNAFSTDLLADHRGLYGI